MSLTKVSYSMIQGASLNVFDFMTDAEIADVKAGTRTLDVTLAVQNAINASDGKGLFFPNGAYKVTTVEIGGEGRTIWFDEATLYGGAVSGTDCVVRYKALQSNIFGMRINGNFNLNYSYMLWWYDATRSSQFNCFFGLEIFYAKVAMLYGAVPPASATNFAQSENTIYGFRTRGLERGVIMNHGNGFLFMEGQHLSVQGEEWATNSPGNFDTSLNHAFLAYAGTLSLNGGELQNSIAASTSVGPRIEGGRVLMTGVVTEVSAPFGVSGKLYINGGRIFNTQSLTPQFYIATGANALSVIEVNDCTIERSDIVGSFSSQPLVNNVGSSDNIDITFKDCEIREWASFVQLANGNQQSVRYISCKYYPNGTQDPRYAVYKLDTNGQDITDLPNIDKKGYSTNGFYLTVSFGAGSSIALNADVPNAYYANSIQVLATGEAYATTADSTTLNSIKSTGFSVTQFDNFMIEGWFKIVDTGTGVAAGAGLVVFDSAGTLVTFYNAFTNNASVMTTGWKYLRGIVQIPSGSTAAYAGFGIRGNLNTVRMTGLKIRRANWNIN